jgi:hypothetical protein
MVKALRNRRVGWFRLVAIVFILALVLVLQPGSAYAGVYKDFWKAWAERDARHVAEHAQLDKAAREATENLMVSLKESSPEMPAKMERMFTAIDAAWFIDGRVWMLRDLRIHMEKKPSAAKTELWLQERIDSLRAEERAVKAKWAEVDGMREKGASDLLVYLQESVLAVSMAATLRGKVEELNLLDQNLASYFRAKGQEDMERRQARARIFGAMGAALSAYSRPQPDTSWTATCTTFGNRTNCHGN